MKKIVIVLAFVCALFSMNVQAQSFDLGMLDNAMSLINQGKQSQAAGLLEKAGSLLSEESKGSKNQFGGKILSQIGLLSSVLPSLAKGNANLATVSKIINTIKTLQAASNLSNLIGGGLKGNGSKVAGNIGILKTGLSMLNLGGNTNKIVGVLDKVSGKSAKLDKKGLFSGLAQKGAAKKLNSSLGLLGSMF
jgi:hypothetical protein